MMEFFNSLDARMKVAFQRKLDSLRGNPGQDLSVDAQALVEPGSWPQADTGFAATELMDAQLLDEAGSPVFLTVGSLAGVSYKDAVAFVRGLAEEHVVSPELGMYYVHNDKEQGRYVYEIHEGGPGRAIVPALLEALRRGETVRVALVNGAHVAIEDLRGEVIALVYPRVESALEVELLESEAQNGTAQRKPVHVSSLLSKVKLHELFPQDKKMMNAGAMVLAFGFFLFMLTGASYTVVRTGVLDANLMTAITKKGYIADASDNPVWQMEKARAAAVRASKPLKTLKKGPEGWTWELQE